MTLLFYVDYLVKLFLSMQLKRKSEGDYEGELSVVANSPGYAEAVNSPLRTPMSGKGGRTNNRSKVSKSSICGPQTPVSNVGEYCNHYIHHLLHGLVG